MQLYRNNPVYQYWNDIGFRIDTLWPEQNGQHFTNDILQLNDNYCILLLALEVVILTSYAAPNQENDASMSTFEFRDLDTAYIRSLAVLSVFHERRPSRPIGYSLEVFCEKINHVIRESHVASSYQ